MRILILVTTAILSWAVPVAADSYRSVTTGNVNLRAGAGVGHERIATLPRGTEVFVDGCRRGWCLVDSLGLTGWVSARYIDIAGTGVVERFVPSVVPAPPVATFDFVVPRDYHDYGYSHHHKPNRNFHGPGR